MIERVVGSEVSPGQVASTGGEAEGVGADVMWLAVVLRIIELTLLFADTICEPTRVFKSLESSYFFFSDELTAIGCLNNSLKTTNPLKT